MNATNRDILLLSKKANTNKTEMEKEVEKLHQMLFHAEALENFCIVNEIIDLQRYKVITDPLKIERMIRQRKISPFIFINNKN